MPEKRNPFAVQITLAEGGRILPQCGHHTWCASCGTWVIPGGHAHETMSTDHGEVICYHRVLCAVCGGCC